MRMHQFPSRAQKVILLAILFSIPLAVLANVPSGPIITLVAGTPQQNGYSGDGGQATQAKLNYLGNVVVDNQGNIYVADHNNHMVRKIDISGFISLYSDLRPMNGGPWGLYMDGNNDLYITDNNNRRLYRQTPLSSTLTRIDPISSYLSGPSAVTVDNSGNIYVCDWNNSAVYKEDTHGNVTTFLNASTNLGSGAHIGSPSGIWVDPSGNIYLSDSWGYDGTAWTTFLLKIDTQFHITRLLDGSPLGGIESLSYDGAGGDLLLADDSDYVYKYNISSTALTALAGNGSYGYSGDGGPALSAKLYYPNGAASDSYGNVYIADADNYIVRKVAKVVPPQPGYAPVAGPNIVAAPMPVKAGQQVCLYYDTAPASAKWTVYNTAGEVVAALNFSGPARQCWDTGAAKLAPGLYWVQIKGVNPDNTYYVEWKRIAVKP